MTKLVRTSTIRTATLAAALSLVAAGALAQSAGSAATTLGYSVGSAYVRQDGAILQQRPLTVMGMTGGIEPKYPATTGSILNRPTYQHLSRAR